MIKKNKARLPEASHHFRVSESGASAGSIDAFSRCSKAILAKSGIAYVIALCLYPTHRRALHEIPAGYAGFSVYKLFFNPKYATTARLCVVPSVLVR
jgi:hypothetical protein